MSQRQDQCSINDLGHKYRAKVLLWSSFLFTTNVVNVDQYEFIEFIIQYLSFSMSSFRIIIIMKYKFNSFPETIILWLSDVKTQNLPIASKSNELSVDLALVRMHARLIFLYTTKNIILNISFTLLLISFARNWF